MVNSTIERRDFLAAAASGGVVSPEVRRQVSGRDANVRGTGLAFRSMWNGSESGETVTPDDAVGMDVVWACVNVLTQAMASLPLGLYRRDPDGNRSTVRDHPTSEIVSVCPNDEMTSYEWRALVMYDVILRGNHVSQVVRNGAGDVVMMWPLEWQRVQPKRRESGELVYEYAVRNGDKIVLERSEVFHVRGLSGNGLVGMSMVDMSQEILGESKRAGKHAARTLRNTAGPNGVVQVEGKLADLQFDRLRESWDDLTQQGKTRILEGGATWVNTVMSNEESQLLESRKWYRTVVASLLRVPAHLINDLERATFSNIEHQDIGFVKHTLVPWMTNWEQRLAVSLLTAEERASGLYYKHNANAVMRGDFVSRMQGYNMGIQTGIFTRNEVRALEDMNGYEGGDVPIMNGNMVTEPDGGSNDE